METTWAIKPTAKWHDGEPVTAEDFIFTAMVAQDRTQPMAQDQAFKFVESVDSADPHTLVVTWKSTYVDADKLFTQTVNTRNLPMPQHLLGPVYSQDKTTFTDSPYFGAEYVGAGPFRLKDWTLGTHVVLSANDAYVLGRPKIDEIEIKFILDTNTMISNLLAGALDLSLGRGLTPEQAIEIRNKWTDGRVDAGLQNTTSLYPNLYDPDPAALKDARFRRALLTGLDRQEMVDSLLGGLVPVADSIFSPDDPEYKDLQSSMVRYPFDPRKATEMLDEMGLAKGADGFYADSSGKRISVEVRTRAHPLREKVQQVIADEWAKIGIEGAPLVVPEQRISDRVYQATFPGFYFRFGGPDQLVDWQSKEAPTAENGYVGRNPIRYQNADYDALITKLVTTIPKDERLKTMAEMVHWETDQLLLLTLYHEPEPVLISNRLKNVGGRRGYNIQAWNAQDWDVAQ
ncbi:MAG TPA: ABC transporter substrate-binding protein [Chloroflexota bacterium]|nr:ABC transporter substrate-binding protein [Chloroflexota bacterium]